ncbi:helix-turn-helix domain-containing protein [Bradyrhizobium erythrophlei]|uniref:AraC family transcriptional regulator n=1 Tax=Bradyrhizobium erythrophlei TaxID=1437360 RepID=UPI0035ED90EC
MTQTVGYGRKLGQAFRLEQVPPSLITRSLRGIKLEVTETRNDNPVPGLSGSFAREDAFLVSLKLRDYPDCELWERSKCVKKADVRAGATYLYDLKHDPRYVIGKPSHSLFFYLSRSVLDDIAAQSGAPRIGNLGCEPGTGHDDAIIRHIGASLMEGLCRPDEANQLFIDHTMLAFAAHVAQAYGGMRHTTELMRRGLAPWQVKRACERLESDLGGKFPLAQIATELDLSTSHFSRAFRASTGMPPHQWLLHQRVKAAKQMMAARDLPLADIALSAGFANQSHFTRVFSTLVGVSPGAWRRAHGAPESET